MNLSPGEVTQKYPKIHVDNQQRRVSLYYHALDTVYFREVGFFLKLHPRYTNRYQLMTLIEDYIESKFQPRKKIKVDVNSRMHFLGNKDRIETQFMFLTCGDVKLVTTAVQEMIKKLLLPGVSRFCGVDVHGAGELVYRRLLNDHAKHINDAKINTIVYIHTPDLETFLSQKRNGFSIKEAYLQSNDIVIEPSNLRGKFHFLAHDQETLDNFIDTQLFPKLMDFKPEETPRILSRGLRKENYSDDNAE